MPLYEFECPACGGFEASRPVRLASSPLRCPSCKRRAPRILSVVAIGRGARPTAGKEPRRVVRREKHERTPAPRPQAAHGRPWMMGH